MDSSGNDLRLTPFMEELLSVNEEVQSKNVDALLDDGFENCTLIGCHFYIDTVGVYFGTNLSEKDQKYIQPDPKKIVYNSHPMKYRRMGYWVKLSLHQPTRDVLERLIEISRHNFCHVTELALAVDEIYESEEEVKITHDFYNHHIVKKNHGKQKVKVIGETTHYQTKKYSHVNLVSYADKPCRFTGKPCVHTEMRFKYRGTFLKMKIFDLQDLLPLTDSYILESIFKEQFNKHFAFYEIGRKAWIRIGKVLTNETKRNSNRIKRYSYNGRVICQFNFYERVGKIFFRGLMEEENQNPTVKEFIDLMKKQKISIVKYLDKIEHACFWQ